MSSEGNAKQEVVVTDMTSNVILRYNIDGTIDAKITAPTRINPSNTGSVYLNGSKYTIASFNFARIWN